MRKILFGLAALFAVLATLGLAPSANAAMTGDGTYTAHSESAGATYTTRAPPRTPATATAASPSTSRATSPLPVTDTARAPSSAGC